ncbi:MAG: LamG domain-containing protein, partial [Deltaproteobacteria bacterium]|nr:LamG domain-containing protein [Deltaproteobacteria bacterium]
PGQEYRIGVVFDGTDTYIYVDGVKMGTAAGPDVSDALGTAIAIGHTGSGGNSFYGWFKDVVIYGQALDEYQAATA